MTEKIFLTDSYARECDAKVVSVIDGTKVILDRTVCYPTGGGQPADFGSIECSGKIYSITEAKKQGGDVVHFVSEAGLKEGDAVTVRIDWERRYALMRMHTAAHVLGTTMHEQDWLVTGNQLDVDQTRFDFSMESFDRVAFDAGVAKVNERLASGADVKVSELPREQALAIPGMVKLANALPPDLPVLRIVEIVGIDVQADGGTHVHNTREVGGIEIVKLDNKGAKNKRVYYRLTPAPASKA